MPTKRICVIGTGRWGKNHLRTLNELGCLAGVVDSDPDTLEAVAADYPDAARFSDYREAAEADFDGFTVASSAETHHTIARYLLERCRPVLVEKPMTLTAEDSRDLAQLADSTGTPLMVGHVMLFHPAIRAIKRLIDDGSIGRLQYLYSNRLNLGAIRSEENILWSFAPHDISIFQYLIGSKPVEVVSRGGAFIRPGIHDTTMTVLTYPENIVSHIFVSWLHPFKEHRLVVIGSEGMLSYEDSSPDKLLRYYAKGVDWVRGEPIPRNGPTDTIPYDPAQPLTEELLYFIERLDCGQIESVDGWSGVEVLEILERATASLME
jgi:UDP-2-acetamido-3-amino-2,3-dideoxy-glucuronate N-acetyltransferase